MGVFNCCNKRDATISPVTIIKPRTLGVLKMACLGYMTVCAGPYGIEDAVRAGGPGMVLLALAILPILWGFPQSLMTAEMANMFQEHNGGYVEWVYEGLDDPKEHGTPGLRPPIEMGGSAPEEVIESPENAKTAKKSLLEGDPASASKEGRKVKKALKRQQGIEVAEASAEDEHAIENQQRARINAMNACNRWMHHGCLCSNRKGFLGFKHWSVICSYNSNISGLLDLALYLVYFRLYLIPFLGLVGGSEDLSWGMGYLAQAVALIFITGLNIIGVSEVASVTILIGIALICPFIVEVPLAWDSLQANISTVTEISPNIDWTLFISVILWNYQGWDMLGCMAGEVKNAKRTYPVGVTLAILFLTFTYLVPVMVGVSVTPDYLNWNDNEITRIALKIGSNLGIWVAVGSMFSMLGNFNVMMATTARAVWAMGRQRIVPPCLWLGDKWEKRPLGSLTLLFLSTLALMLLPLDVLVVLDTCFSNVALMLETIAFVRLRYLRPHANRPFKVYCGLPGAWYVAVAKSLVIGMGLATAASTAWIVCFATNVFLVIVIYTVSCFPKLSWRTFCMGCLDGKRIVALEESEDVSSDDEYSVTPQRKGKSMEKLSSAEGDDVSFASRQDEMTSDAGGKMQPIAIPKSKASRSSSKSPSASPLEVDIDVGSKSSSHRSYGVHEEFSMGSGRDKAAMKSKGKTAKGNKTEKAPLRRSPPLTRDAK